MAMFRSLNSPIRPTVAPPILRGSLAPHFSRQWIDLEIGQSCDQCGKPTASSVKNLVV